MLVSFHDCSNSDVLPFVERRTRLESVSSQLLVMLNTVLDSILYGIYGENLNLRQYLRRIITRLTFRQASTGASAVRQRRMHEQSDRKSSGSTRKIYHTKLTVLYTSSVWKVHLIYKLIFILSIHVALTHLHSAKGKKEICDFYVKRSWQCRLIGPVYNPIQNWVSYLKALCI